MKEFIINENEAGQRFDKYLGKLLREAPKSFFYKMLRKKNITLNGGKATGNEKLTSGDHVKLFLSDETFEKFAGSEEKVARAHQKLEIVYEDENVLLINKPAGMLSQPADDKEPSLVEYLTGYLLEDGSCDRSFPSHLPPVRVQPPGPKYQRNCGCGQNPCRAAGALWPFPRQKPSQVLPLSGKGRHKKRKIYQRIFA